ncbi:MAG: glycogen/starch synthase [Cryomorphaceae bacterium]|nr:glycogen/starch synthase [Cryomorphaceae bacterium]
MEKKRILYVSQEICPYLPENDLSKISLQLPKKMTEMGHEVRVFMPRFGVINERRHQLHEVIRLSGINIVINDLDMPLIIKVASVPQARMQVYFIDNEELFKRKFTHFDENGEAFADNEHRMIFFCKGVVETVKKLGWAPDVIHCHGWMASFLPTYLRQYYKDDALFANSKIIYSSYSYPYDTVLSGKHIHDILAFDGVNGIPSKDLKKPFVDKLQIIGIGTADAVMKLGRNSDDINAFIEEKNIPVLEFNQESDDLKKIQQFYEEVVSEESLA